MSTGYTGTEADLSHDALAAHSQAALVKAMREANEVDKYGGGKPEKLFGLFEVDPSIAAAVKALYNSMADFARNTLAPKAHALTITAVNRYTPEKYVGKINASKTAAVVAGTVSVGFKAGGFLYKIGQSFADQQTERKDLARKLAPVLDDLKGGHSAGKLTSVTREENSIIYTHRKRMAKIAGNQNTGNFMDLAINAGPNLLIEAGDFKKMWKDGKTPQEINAEKAQAAAASNAGHNTAAGGVALNSATGIASEMVLRANERKLKESLSGYSALEMLMTLEEQVSNNPATKQFYPPGKNTKAVSLEDYLVRVMVVHQQELADIDTDESEIRDALMEDLMLVAKPMAKALRSGDMSAMAMIRLLGEGHVVKGHGRVIVSAEEVEAQIERMEGKKDSRGNQSPKDYYGTSSFTREDLQAALKTLDGEERQVVCSWFSDAVLEDAGMSSKDIKQIRSETTEQYEQHLLTTLKGVFAKSDDDLKAEGMATAEIRQLRAAQEKIERKGDQEIHHLKESPANTHGVERLLANLAIPQVIGDKQYVGKVLTAGKQRAEPKPAANDESYGPRHAANDETYSARHAARTQDAAADSYAERY